MDFRLSEEEKIFVAEVTAFLEEEGQHPEAADFMAPDREADSMLADSAARRAFNGRLGARGYLGMSWPKQYGGSERPGIYEYLLNEELAGRGAPLVGKGVGCIGKTLIRHGSESLKSEFLPRILDADIEFALGYSEPNAGSDLAALKLRATKTEKGWVLDGQKTFTTSAHFADWYWVAARTDANVPKHKGISVFLIPMDHPGLTIQEIKTMGDHRTNAVFFDQVEVGDEYLVGEVNKGWTYVCEALDFERFTFFTVNPIITKFRVLLDLLKSGERFGAPLTDDPLIVQQIGRLAADVEAAKMLQRRVIIAASKGEVPAVEAAMYKLFSTQLGQRLADFALDALGPQGLLSHGAPDAQADGKWEHSYRATVLDTIGGGSSEVQKNIIARRGLGLQLS